MKLRRWQAALLAGMLAAGLLIGAPGVGGQSSPKEPPPPPPERIVDADGNKIFDNLERRMATATAGQPFDVIVLLSQPLDQVDFPGLREQLGLFDLKFQYHSINGFATTWTKRQIQAAAQLVLVQQIELDLEARAFLDRATEWFGVDKAVADFGVTGDRDGNETSYSADDIVIAVIDSGIDDSHVDLDGGKVIAWADFHSATGSDPTCATPCDPSGHGTFVSSTAAGTGEGDSRFVGVAPGAALVGLRVLNEGGSASFSIVNEAVQWVIDNKERNAGTAGGDAPDADIEIFNMSLGADGCSDGTDSSSQLVNAAVAAGLVAVISAGNAGPGTCTVGIPGAAEHAITLGAMGDVTPGPALNFSCGPAPSRGFFLVCFSSRGPTADDRIKPDIAGPGVNISAAEAGTGNGYRSVNGTSFSAPFTAGVAALMFDADPMLTPADVKSTLKSTAIDWGPAGEDINYGAGRLDAHAAVKTAAGNTDPALVGPEVPDHLFFADTLTGTGDEDFFTINVSEPSLNLAVTMIMDDDPVLVVGGGPPRIEPDFDIELRDPTGILVASSNGTTRQETVGVQAAATGDYQLRVFSFRESGDYIVDISVGAPLMVDIALTSDGALTFGTLELSAVADSSNDVQTVQVVTGTADIDLRTTLWTDVDGDTWSLDTTLGADQVAWEFSTDGTNWTAFTAANLLFPAAQGLTNGQQLNLFFRLTMPTEITSSKEHSVTVTIVATSPD